MKKLLLALLGSALLGGGILYWRLGSLVKAAVEEFGPKLTGTSVTLRHVVLSPFSGKGRFSGLEIGSPEGFSEPCAFKLDDVRVSVDLKSLASDTIHVREIVVEGPEVHYEVGAGGTNLAKLQKNVESSLPASGGSGAPSPAAKPKKVRIDLFVARGGKVHVNIMGAKAVLPLPDVELKGIGSDGGTSMKEAFSRITGSLTSSALQAVRGAGGSLGGAAKSLESGSKAAAEGLSRSFKGLFKK
jgi:hypothetical protein